MSLQQSIRKTWMKAAYEIGDAKYRPVIKKPTICPKCETVYSHKNPIKECLFCNWVNHDFQEDDDF